MNKQQKDNRRRTRHERQIARRLEKRRETARAIDDPEDTSVMPLDMAPQSSEPEEEDWEEGDDIQDEEETNTQPTKADEPEVAEPAGVRKDMGYAATPDMAMPLSGPTSWDELDAARAAEEQAHEIRMAGWDTEDLVHNILNHPMMDAAEKAGAIEEVGSGLGDRISGILSGSDDGGDMQKDIDLLQLEAMIEADRRHMTAKERIADWLTKAKLSYAAKQSKPDSAYALVVTRGGKKVRKYLIHDKAHVRNALARAAQMIKRGGPAASDAKAALPKIHAAAKRMGIGEMNKEVGAVLIEKDAKGDWRWVGWPSNNFLDLHGDIIAKEAHKDFVDFLDHNPDMAPLFMTWHMPGTERASKPDYWAFENGFLIMSGKLTEPEAASLLKAKAATDIGMSLSGFGIRDPKDPRVIVKYRAFEVSDLPLENAANPFTDFAVLAKMEDDMDKQKYLAAILGSEEKATAFLEKTGLKQAALEKAGIEQKSAESKTEEAATGSKTVATTVQQAAAALKPEQQAIVEEVFKQLDVEGLNHFLTEAKDAFDKVAVLEGVIKDMQSNQDEKLAERIAPPASKFVWALKERASTSDSSKIEKDDKLAQAAPEVPWLSQVTGTKPLPANTAS